MDHDFSAPPTPFDNLIGTTFVQAGPDRVVLELEIRSDHHQTYGVVHGGVYCALAETAASVGAALAIMEKTGSPSTGAVGQSNHTDFLKAMKEGSVTAVATPAHIGRSVQLWEVEMTNQDDELVATSKVRLFNVGVDRLTTS